MDHRQLASSDQSVSRASSSHLISSLSSLSFSFCFLFFLFVLLILPFDFFDVSLTMKALQLGSMSVTTRGEFGECRRMDRTMFISLCVCMCVCVSVCLSAVRLCIGISVARSGSQVTLRLLFLASSPFPAHPSWHTTCAGGLGAAAGGLEG